jgi:uncharacterized Zn-finger protein
MSWKGLFNGFWFVRVVLVLWIVSVGFVVFLLGRIDGIVHGDLYGFGLQFSPVWAQPYWAFLRLVYVCLAVPLVLSGLVLVFGVFRRGDGVGGRVVRGGVGRRVRGEDHMVVSCPKCRRVFGKPLVMLDFGGGKGRLVSVCPYCSHVLGCADADEKEDGGVRVGGVEEREEEVEEG